MEGEVERIYEAALTAIMLVAPEGSRVAQIASRALIEAVRLRAPRYSEMPGQPAPGR